MQIINDLPEIILSIYNGFRRQVLDNVTQHGLLHFDLLIISIYESGGS
jgi:hypothetical protein